MKTLTLKYPIRNEVDIFTKFFFETSSVPLLGGFIVLLRWYFVKKSLDS